MQNEEIMALNEKKEDELGRRGRLETFFLLTLQWIIGMTLFSNLLPNQIISKLEPLEQNANYSIRLHRNGIISITMTMEKSKVNLFFFFLWMSFCNKEESFVEQAREKRREEWIRSRQKQRRRECRIVKVIMNRLNAIRYQCDTMKRITMLEPH